MKAMQSLGMNKSKQQGFTLVEIAIVLVIIGLLLGGVLKGQSLINSARVRNMADQNSAVQAAYYGFIDRYRAVPGDMPPAAACNAIGANQMGIAACPGAIGGNGDGRLGQGDFPEAAELWKHLSAANFIVGDYSGIAGNAAAYLANTVAPANVFGSPIILGRTNTYLGTPTIRLALYTGRDLPVSLLSELDTKVDDGRPSTGVLRATNDTGGDYGSVGEREAGCTSSAAPLLWDVSTDSQDCNAIYLY